MLKHSSSEIFLSLDLARRYARAQRSHFSNVGRLAFLGLVLSVSVLVIVISVVNGFDRELRTRVLGLLPGLSVQFDEGLHPADLATLTPLADQGVVGSPYIQGQVLLVKDGEISAAQLTGIVPNEYRNITQLFEYTELSSYEVLIEDSFDIILGAGIAERLNVSVGDDLRLVMPVASVSAAGAVPRQRRMRVADILSSNSLLDSQAAYVHLAIAQRLFRQSVPQGLHIRVPDLFATNAIANQLYEIYDDRVRIRSWMDRYGNLFQAIAVQKLTMFFLLLFLVAVAAFNLISGLVMMVEQRKADIAVLATLGLGSRGIMTVFIALGLVVAVGGIVLGLLLGVLIATTLPHVFAGLSQVFEANLMSQYFINYLPSEVRRGDLATIGAVSVVLAALATLFPAWRATRLVPVEVLSHE